MDTADLPKPPGTRAPRRGRRLTTRIALAETLGDGEHGPDDDRTQRALRTVRAESLALSRGTWDALADARQFGAASFVLSEGAILRRVRAGHREGAELLGAGDIFQPAVETQDVSWRVASPAVVGILDARVITDAGAVPELLAALTAAALVRVDTVARQLVIAQWSSVDDRIVATLEMLSERWGVMTPDGVALPGFLTHSVLAPLVGARRPSVTTSLKRLDADGRVRRNADGRWILPRP